MMGRAVSFTLALLCGLAAAKEGCEDFEAQVKELKQKLAEAEAKVDSAISVIGIISHSSSLAGESVTALLDQTDMDEQVYEKVATHLGAAKQMTVDFLGQVQNIDYAKSWKTVTDHEVYKTHIAPTVDAAHKAAEPIMKEHVHPAINKAHAAVKPHLDEASKHLNEVVYPTLQKSSSMVYESADFSAVTTRLGGLVDPVFAHVSKNHPKIRKFLPGDAWDRVLFLIVSVFAFYYFTLTTYFLVKKALQVTKTTTSLVVQLFIVFPLWILWRLIRLALCLTTCGFCCGLFRGKKVETKAAGDGKQAAAAKVEKLTVAEVAELLEKSKGKDKLQEAAKLLVSTANEGKPIKSKKWPDNVQNKVLDKDTLKKAIAKHKELDAKKLGL